MAYRDSEQALARGRQYWHTVRKIKLGVVDRQQAKKQRNLEICEKLQARTHQQQDIVSEYGISRSTVVRIMRQHRKLELLANPMQVKEHYTPNYLYDYDGEIIRVLRTGREIKFSDVR
jgi:hypothetical protein